MSYVYNKTQAGGVRRTFGGSAYTSEQTLGIYKGKGIQLMSLCRRREEKILRESHVTLSAWLPPPIFLLSARSLSRFPPPHDHCANAAPLYGHHPDMHAYTHACRHLHQIHRCADEAFPGGGRANASACRHMACLDYGRAEEVLFLQIRREKSHFR